MGRAIQRNITASMTFSMWKLQTPMGADIAELISQLLEDARMKFAHIKTNSTEHVRCLPALFQNYVVAWR